MIQLASLLIKKCCGMAFGTQVFLVFLRLALFALLVAVAMLLSLCVNVLKFSTLDASVVYH